MRLFSRKTFLREHARLSFVLQFSAERKAMRSNLVTTSNGNLSATQSARMLLCSRLLRLAESLWHQRLKTPGRNCTQNLHKSRLSQFPHPLLLRLAQFVLSFRLQQHHNQKRNLKLHKRHSQSTLAMKSRRCGFRTLSKMSLLMRFRFQRTMI